ncbi:M48 family metalloprotease [Nonomuraea sp. NPDC004580]|uniref:M48 family metalloprotease n=1 Tax=Nonomuraea sp. NPDC004580 TaxID=3154552 RepID=UPI0033BEFFE0
MARHGEHALVARMIVAALLLALVYAVPVAWLVLAGGWAVAAAGLVAAVAAQWWSAEWLARRMAGARLVDAEQEPVPHAVLDRLCALSDVPKPRVAVTEDAFPNACTVGRSRRHTTVVVTRGLLDLLEPDELTAALAHEVAHVRHRDVAFMTVAGSPAAAMTWGARVAGGFVRRNRGPRSFVRQLCDLPLAVLLYWLYPLILLFGLVGLVAQLPLRALSRYRELAADRDAAVQTGRPALLAATLLKVSQNAIIPRTDLRAVLSMASLVPAKRARFSWWSTHPGIAERVDHLT